MLNWMNVSFNVLVNSKDELKLEKLMTEFVDELNKSTDNNNICVATSLKFESNYIDDIKFENILEKGLDKLEKNKV